MNSNRGFTFIELVLSIVVLGILSAIAIPKFIDLRSNARAASIQTALGAIQAASSTVHALFLAPGTSPATVSMDGTTISITTGYANCCAANQSITTAAGITAGTSAGNYTITTASPSVTISIVGATDPATCRVVYTNGNPATITSATAGC